MTVTKNEERGYWEVLFYYKDYTGKRKQKHKRGFKTKKEAVTWAEQFIVQQSHIHFVSRIAFPPPSLFPYSQPVYKDF